MTPDTLVTFAEQFAQAQTEVHALLVEAMNDDFTELDRLTVLAVVQAVSRLGELLVEGLPVSFDQVRAEIARHRQAIRMAA